MNNETNKLQVFLKRIKRSIESLNLFVRMIYGCRADEDFDTFDWNKNIMGELREAVFLINEFNKLTLEGNFKIKNCKIDDDLNYLEDVSNNIRELRRELQTARDYLDLYLNRDISEEERSKILPLRDEIEKLKRNDCDLLVLQNLEEALNEAEHGHHLACSIISGRIIDNAIQSIKKQESLPNDNLNEKIIKRLRELGVLEKDQIAGQDKKEFLDAAKSSRDAVSHNLRFMPNGSRCVSLLSYAFIISDLLIKYNKRKNETKTTT